jgi:hypothetical protein
MLVVNLVQEYAAKVEGVSKNMVLVLNFMLALLASANKKAFECVSRNLCSVSHHHVFTLVAKKTTTPNTSMTKDDICKTNNVDHIAKIHVMDDNPTQQVAFSVGIDAAVLLKSFQISTMYKEQLLALQGQIISFKLTT